MMKRREFGKSLVAGATLASASGSASAQAGRGVGSGAKSDSSDTESLPDLLLRHGERLRPLQPDSAYTEPRDIMVRN